MSDTPMLDSIQMAKSTWISQENGRERKKALFRAKHPNGDELAIKVGIDVAGKITSYPKEVYEHMTLKEFGLDADVRIRKKVGEVAYLKDKSKEVLNNSLWGE
jgi:hypothetical protein